MNHDQNDPWAPKDHYPEDATRRHTDKQRVKERSEDSIEREIERRADQGAKDQIQDQAIRDLKSSMESLEFQNRHLLEEVATAKARAKSAENAAEELKEVFKVEAKNRGDITSRSREESKAAKVQAEIALRISKDNRQDLRALGWIHTVLRGIWNHKGKLGSGTGGAIVVGILAKIFGFSPI